MLYYGRGFDPLEWISYLFVPFGPVHLLDNMLFLWGFRLVVEGKVGWWRYLLVYLGIGIVHGFLEQFIMLGYCRPVPRPTGASGVIYGLLAISLVWAPRNEVTCVTIIFFRMVYIFEFSIVDFAGFYIGSQMLMASLVDFAMSSAVIHLLGAPTGFGVGALTLKINWVDCEN